MHRYLCIHIKNVSENLNKCCHRFFFLFQNFVSLSNTISTVSHDTLHPRENADNFVFSIMYGMSAKSQIFFQNPFSGMHDKFPNVL